MHSYDELYLDDAMESLGDAFDYAVYGYQMDLEQFMDMFVVSEVADYFGSGNPKYVAGFSGIELFWEVATASGVELKRIEVEDYYDRSPEYWVGWMLAYYQWYSGRSFREIHRKIKMEDMLRLYPTMHEAPEDKCLEIIEEYFVDEEHTRLHTLRRLTGYSQKLLSEKSGVSLRMIQQYEQRAKDINKATGVNLKALADTMGCSMEDLME